MCLAIPSKVVSVSNETGVVEADGVKRDVSFLLLDDVRVGDYVVVHAGFAINKVDQGEALATLDILKKALKDE